MTMTAGSTFTITQVDPLEDTDDVVIERVELSNRLRAEILPDDPPQPPEPALAAQRVLPTRYRRYSFRVRDDAGRLVGGAGGSIDPDHDDNPDMFWMNINLLPECRRFGLGTQLLARVVAVARQEGRTRLIANTNEGAVGGREFAEAVGAEMKSYFHMNALYLDEVDRTMLERWMAEGPERAADYELISWDGPVPDEHMANWLELVLVMNTAPRDDLEMNDFTITEEEVRESERVQLTAGVEPWTIVARRRSDGVWAGFHDVGYHPADPGVVHVGATGVLPEHRGHALGKWLKAAMTLRVLDERPQVKQIRTGNADSNDAMLGINKAMGYRPVIAQTTWELSVDAAEAWLRGRGVAID